jgi:hypothetical protein
MGSQRISSTEMSTNVAEAGLYYWDVELVSFGTGDLWNVDQDSNMVMDGFRSDGYYLTTTNPNLSMSPEEGVFIHMSRSILGVGVDDEPENATQLSGQSLSISYEYSQTTDDLHSFVLSDVQRVVNSSPLARHLIPHFVRFDLTYGGGPPPEDLKSELEDLIRGVIPDQPLESSDIQKIISDGGADSITNPIDIIAVIYAFDRSVYLARSQDALTTGRLAAFIPERINLTRRTT